MIADRKVPDYTPEHDHRRALTADEVAKILHVRKQEIYNLVRQNAIPYRRIGKRYIRFWLPDIEKFMRGEEVNG
jgi:excisionase family DNA binding protein